jgi:hypothetical protein
MNVQEIQVRITNVYGQRTVYPVCDIAHKLVRLLNTKTFTRDAIGQLQALGYVFVVQPEVL